MGSPADITHLAVRTPAISALLIFIATLLDHISGVSSSCRFATCLITLLSIAAAMLPKLGRGLVTWLVMPASPWVSAPAITGVPVNLGGRGNREAEAFGDEGSDPNLPFETR
jgi:hypothetical protein